MSDQPAAFDVSLMLIDDGGTVVAKESRQGRMADALAHGGDEGRDQLR